MEEPLKARLIGASILVLLAVALVPELLSGPKDSASGGRTTAGAKNTRTVTIDLGGAVADGARLEPRPDAASVPPAAPSLPTVESPAAAAAAAPAPVTEAQPVSKPENQPAARAAAALPPARVPEARPAAIEPLVQTAATAKGKFSVQVGAFGSEATARKLVADLEADGMPAYIAPLSKSGKTLHRVRAGPVPDRAAADKLAARLKARGLPVAVVSGG
ncbi:MAG: SPOR domain-containing protein [Steroidobacteraceae bacterium]|nr:SPOR domain-containing protein [Pseudomonadota bacterium]MBP6107618.1 SPOR domain-containing protein [Steroidobacteraceae bacterium]MBP7014525.1 SPOR domain-containing protein [Steroidobacteraceae bacterium]